MFSPLKRSRFHHPKKQVRIAELPGQGEFSQVFLFGLQLATLPETNSSHPKMDGWNTN